MYVSRYRRERKRKRKKSINPVRVSLTVRYRQKVGFIYSIGKTTLGILINQSIIFLIITVVGSLASSLLDPSVCVVGASGGVYSLLAGHMAHLLLNYSAVQYGPARIVGLIAVASLEVSSSICFKKRFFF